jgi:L-threonylcarbamoyladenylate synthase
VEKIGKSIHITKELLINKELVAIPTETVYGLAANAFEPTAVQKIYEAKKRPSFNPLIIHSHSLSAFEAWGIEIPNLVRQLAEKFSPGPITYVVKASAKIPGIVTAGTGTVGIRIPNHPLTLALLQELDFPLAAPSANPSTYVSPTTAQHVKDQLGEQVSYILDGGPCTIGLESTIVSFVNPTPQLLRYGAITQTQIEEVIGKIEDTVSLKDTDNPVAPGMLKRHYATNTPLYIEEFDVTKWAGKKTIYLTHTKVPTKLAELTTIIALSYTNDLNEVASNLYSALRLADALNVEAIIVQPISQQDLGRTINDRLSRAISQSKNIQL